MKIKKAIKTLIKAMNEDPGYRIGWQANIAMAFIDSEHNYRRKNFKGYLNRTDKHNIANDAANNFLNLLGK